MPILFFLIFMAKFNKRSLFITKNKHGSYWCINYQIDQI